MPRDSLRRDGCGNPAGSDAQQPQFAPDGQRLAYKSREETSDRITTAIHVADPGDVRGVLVDDITNDFRANGRELE